MCVREREKEGEIVCVCERERDRDGDGDVAPLLTCYSYQRSQHPVIALGNTYDDAKKD